MVQWLHCLDPIRSDQHGAVRGGGTARRLRVLAVSFSRRQASVLLASDEPHGAARCVCVAVLSALFCRWSFRYALGGGAGSYALQHPARRVDPRRLHVRRAKGARRDRLCRRLLFLALFLSHFHAYDRFGVRRRLLFLLYVFLGRVAARQDLTSVAAKPIAALMTKTASTSGYQLGLLAAAGALTLIPGAVVIYFVRNYIAKGFALGRV